MTARNGFGCRRLVTDGALRPYPAEGPRRSISTFGSVKVENFLTEQFVPAPPVRGLILNFLSDPHFGN